LGIELLVGAPLTPVAAVGVGGFEVRGLFPEPVNPLEHAGRTRRAVVALVAVDASVSAGLARSSDDQRVARNDEIKCEASRNGPEHAGTAGVEKDVLVPAR
jgi:hypothetical protein